MLTATLENVLNRGLPRSPRAQQLCAELAGRRLAIDVNPIGRLLLESTGVSLKLSIASPEVTADASISAGPLSMLSLAGPEAEAAIRAGRVRIEGDGELAQKFRELIALLRPDPEEELALFLGDVPAHQFARLARGALGWGARAADTTTRNLAEYLAHERGDLVSQGEADAFFGDVDSLRDGVDRLAARLDLLPPK